MVTTWVASPNFKAGRVDSRGKKRTPIAIVDHITAGLMPGCLSWLQNPESKASAHYLVCKNGKIYQLVRDEDTAWAAGNINKPAWSLYDGTNPNVYTINIEHEALEGEALTEAQYQSTLELHISLCKKWNIPMDREHIIGHYRLDTVNRKNDADDEIPWNRLFTDLTNNQLASNEVWINVWGVKMKGVLINNVTYAPARALSEAMGRKVTWNEGIRTVTIE